MRNSEVNDEIDELKDQLDRISHKLFTLRGVVGLFPELVAIRHTLGNVEEDVTILTARAGVAVRTKQIRIGSFSFTRTVRKKTR